MNNNQPLLSGWNLKRLAAFVSREQPLDTINAWLNVLYWVFLLAIYWQLGLSLRLALLLPALLFLRYKNQRTGRYTTHIQSVQILWLLLEFVLLVIVGYSTGGELLGSLFSIYTASIVLNYPTSVAFPFVFVGFTIYLLIFEPHRLNVNAYFFSLINFLPFPIAIFGIQQLIRQRQHILALNQRLQSQAELSAEMTKLRERNNLAEAMHDTMGHTLTASIVSLEGVALLLEKRPSEAFALLDSVRQQLQTGLGDIRQTVRALKTDTLAEDMTLQESLFQLIERVKRQTSVAIEFQNHLAVALLPIQDYVLYSIVREGITNALKHSQATHIQITLAELTEDRIVLTVVDNGIGTAELKLGVGLSHLQQKVAALGGTFLIESQPGFRIQVVLPLAVELAHLGGNR